MNSVCNVTRCKTNETIIMFVKVVILILYNSVFVVGENARPVITLRIHGKECEHAITDPLVIFRDEPFNINVITDSYSEVVDDLKCVDKGNKYKTIASAQIIPNKLDDNNHTITLKYEKTNTMPYWICNIDFKAENRQAHTVTCNLEVSVRQDFILTINNITHKFPVIRDVHSKWHATGVYDYTPGEILGIVKKDSTYHVHAYIVKEDDTVFETKEIGDVNMILNTNYYTGVSTFFLDVSKLKQVDHQFLKLQLIPKKQVNVSEVLSNDDVNHVLNDTVLFEYYGYTTVGAPNVQGLPLNQTVYRLKTEALYEYRDGETLILMCFGNKNTETKWIYNLDGGYQKIIANITMKITLNKGWNGTEIKCNVTSGGAVLTFTIKLRVRREAIGQKMESFMNNSVPDKAIGVTGRPDYSIYMIIAAVLIVTVTFCGTFYCVYNSYRKKKLKMSPNVSYDNLSTATQRPFPPNWNRDNEQQQPQQQQQQQQPTENEEYSVPYANQQEDTKYAEPVRNNNMYEELSERLNKSANVCNGDTYAEVIPKQFRKKLDIYAEICHDSKTYGNVFKGDPYVNCDSSEYAEPAYCTMSDLK